MYIQQMEEPGTRGGGGEWIVLGELKEMRFGCSTENRGGWRDERGLTLHTVVKS